MDEKAVSAEPGTLYVVATPIGNLQDMSARARAVLADVDVIAAEDTRRTRQLLAYYGIRTRMTSLHEHNEAARTPRILEWLRTGKAVALVSDAGTPLVSDPGHRLVSAAHRCAVKVVPVPGASSLLAALSASGLPCDRFVFEGFLPPGSRQRLDRLRELRQESRTMVFFEAPHRVLECLDDLTEAFGGSREGVVARELTKRFETIWKAPLETLRKRLGSDVQYRRGEFVLVVAGAPPQDGPERGATSELLEALLEELPVKQAASLAARLTGERKNLLYEQAVRIKARLKGASRKGRDDSPGEGRNQ